MMQMLYDTFTKLSTVMDNKTSESKSYRSKFQGDAMKFHEWYLAMMAQSALPPWQDLYDSTFNDVVATTSNTILSSKAIC
jgi:hypothetical protein